MWGSSSSLEIPPPTRGDWPPPAFHGRWAEFLITAPRRPGSSGSGGQEDRMARPLWKGHISFGMVSIPVGLFPADRPEELSFELLDDRDLAPIGYRKVNKTSGDEVPREHIARGFRLD